VLERIRPSSWVLRKVGLLGFLAAVPVLAFFWGRHGATAQQPGGRGERGLTDAGGPAYQGRVVAYIYGNVPVTREELGEYLIARFGAERLEFLVNRRIIETACRARGIMVSDAEVDAQLKQDIDSFGGNVTPKDFVNVILKRYNKTLYEWREDVIRPRLALAKFCRDDPLAEVTDADIRKAFEAHHGEKIECRMIVLPKEMDREKFELWSRVSKSEEEFDKQAKQQFIRELAAQAGKIPPIYKHFSDPAIEKAAFALTSPGQVSELLTMPDKTTIILKLVRRIPPNTLAKMEEERPALHKEMQEFKLSQAIPRVFKGMRDSAQPNLLLRREAGPHDQVQQAQQPLSLPGPAPGGLRGQ
jgi:hypothetical protein